MDLENLTQFEVELIMLALDRPPSDRVIDGIKSLWFPQYPPHINALIAEWESAWEKVRNQYDDQV